MPYKSVWEERGLLTRWRGNATTAELIQMQERGHASPNFDFARYSIHDFSECEHFACDLEEIQYSAALDGAAAIANPNIKIPIVAASAEVINAIDHYMKANLSPYSLRFFTSMEEARVWVM